eukprot:scaffold2716_cov179-Amphora_coffeaeformis.AAC.14
MVPYPSAAVHPSMKTHNRTPRVSSTKDGIRSSMDHRQDDNIDDDDSNSSSTDINNNNEPGPHTCCCLCQREISNVQEEEESSPTLECTGRNRHVFCHGCAHTYLESALEPGRSFFLRIRGANVGPTSSSRRWSEPGEIPCPIFAAMGAAATDVPPCDCAALPKTNYLAKSPALTEKYQIAMWTLLHESPPTTSLLRDEDDGREHWATMVQEREDAIADLLEENGRLKRALSVSVSDNITVTTSVVGAGAVTDPSLSATEQQTQTSSCTRPVVETVDEHETDEDDDSNNDDEIRRLREEINGIRAALEEAQDMHVDLEENAANWRNQNMGREEEINRLQDELQRLQKREKRANTNLTVEKERNERLLLRLDVVREKLAATEQRQLEEQRRQPRNEEHAAQNDASGPIRFKWYKPWEMLQSNEGKKRLWTQVFAFVFVAALALLVNRWMNDSPEKEVTDILMAVVCYGFGSTLLLRLADYMAHHPESWLRRRIGEAQFLGQGEDEHPYFSWLGRWSSFRNTYVRVVFGGIVFGALLLSLAPDFPKLQTVFVLVGVLWLILSLSTFCLLLFVSNAETTCPLAQRVATLLNAR